MVERTVELTAVMTAVMSVHKMVVQLAA